MTQRRPSGFTLIETMIVLVILGILATLAAPSFNELIEMQRVKAAAADLYMSLARARSEALKRNANVTLSPKDGGWQAGWQIPNPAGGEMLEDHEAVRGGITIAGPGSVIYRSSGRISGSSTQFSISGAYSSSARCVSLDLGGRPTIKDGAC